MSGKQPPSFYDFGPYRLDPGQRFLLCDGVEVSLTPKAFDTLLVLVQNHGRVVGKDELLRSIWPDAFVEEATLAQNVFTLRKLLNRGLSVGAEYIQTVPKRGYRFSAVVTEVFRVSETSAAQEKTYRAAEASSMAPAIRSIAVLPIMNTTTDPGAEYLSDGLTETLVNGLSMLPDLQIKACSTVARYKGREIDVQEAGRELAVDGIVFGRILSCSESIVVRVELVDVANGWQVWGQQYNEKLEDILKVQEEIARNIAEQLRVKLLGASSERLFKPRTQNPQAFQLYLKGRYFLNKRTTEGYARAIESFEQALEHDPDYAQAHCGLADSYLQFDFYGLVPPWKIIPRARAAVVKALEIDDQLAEAHSSFGSIKLIYDRDPVGSEREFLQAIELNPKYAHAHNGYSHCLMEMGRIKDALAECESALKLEPFDLEINQHLGWHYLFARQYDLAIRQLLRTLEMGPDFYRARLLLGIAYGQLGSFSQAITELLRANRLEQTPVLAGFLGYSHAREGNSNEARRLVGQLVKQSKTNYVPPYSVALIYAGLGERSNGIEWLKRAFVEHDRWQHWLKLTSEFDELRADRGLINFLKTRGIDETQF